MHEEAPEAWNVDFFVEDGGRIPVRNWLDGLPVEVRGKVIARIDLLKKSTAFVEEADKKIGRARMVKHKASLVSRV